MKKLLKIFMLLSGGAIYLLLTGCPIGFSALPLATRKKVTPADIAGKWQYEIYTRHEHGVPTNDGTVTIELRSDGTFEQIVQRKGYSEPLKHTGKWEVTTPPVYLRLEVLKPSTHTGHGDWVVEKANWWVVDSTQKGLKFAVFGAAYDQDPDSCNQFKKLR